MKLGQREQTRIPLRVLPDWIVWMQATGPLLIGAAVVYVAWRQWKTAREKLVLDLFDRRLNIYRQVRSAVNAISASSGAGIGDQHRQLLDAKIEGRFLFGLEVCMTLERIEELGFKLKTFYALRDDNGTFDPETRSEIVGNLAGKVAEQVLQMVNLTDSLGRLLQPYLAMRTKF